jgi:transcriptional regulator with XRE-family HTH domain
VPRRKHPRDLDLTTFHRLGTALRFLREHQGRTAKSVAKAAGITAPMLSSYETEKTLPELLSLDRLLGHGLRVSLADLAWALEVVQQTPVREEADPERKRVAGPTQGPPRSATGRPALRLVQQRPLEASPAKPGSEALAEALEQGYEEVRRGLSRLARAVFDSVLDDADPNEPR